MPMSNAVQKKVLDHLCGDGAYTVTAPVYLALTTVAVTATDTGATITEAGYTGYARKSIAAADLSAATTISTIGSKTNSNAIVFADCTGSTAHVIGWALVTSSSGAGDILFYGTLTAVDISTTATPPTVAVGALVLTAT